MSQTVTYKTKFKNLDDIMTVVEKLIEKGVFGKDAKLHTALDEGFDMEIAHTAYHYNSPKKKQEIKMRVLDGGDEYFTEGFYDKGFAIGQDQDGNIELVFDYNSGRGEREQKVTDEIKKNIEDMLEAGATLEMIARNLNANGVKNNINATSNTEWEIEVEYTPEQLRQILGQ